MIRDGATRWQDALAHAEVGRRPSDDVWSALEYGCHVRDVFALYDERLQMMLEDDDPLYPNWDQDAAAVERRYSEQDPAHVARELHAAAARLADRFDRVNGAQWKRPGRRSDGARFDVESFARYMIHDTIHHLYDVERGFSALSRAASS